MVAEPYSLSIASFVLVLISVALGWTFLMPLGAFILGISGLRKEPADRGFAIAGVAISSCFLLVGH